MIGTIEIAVQAANPQMPIGPMYAFKDSPSSIRIRNVPKKIGKWNITRVYFTTLYPDNQVKSVDCVLTGGVYVGTVDGSTLSGKSENGFTVYADGKDENDQTVAGYILGKGDIYILESDGTITPGNDKSLVKLLDEQPSTPYKGDVYKDSNGTILMWNGTQWIKPLAKVSELENDSGYLTQHQSLSNYYTKDEVDSALSVKADVNGVPKIYLCEVIMGSTLIVPNSLKVGDIVCFNRDVNVIEYKSRSYAGTETASGNYCYYVSEIQEGTNIWLVGGGKNLEFANI